MVIIGVARLFLQPLAHLVEVRQSDLVICDLRGTPIGSMEVSALPYANEQKLPLPEDVLIENPEELIGRKIFFEFHLDSCRALPPKFRVIGTDMNNVAGVPFYILCLFMTGYPLQISIVRR